MTINEFGYTTDKRLTHIYTYTDKSGMEISVTDYGASLVSVKVPDRDGNFIDVVLGYSDVIYYEKQFQCVGSVIGRTCNRIRNARFVLDGKKYKLNKNFRMHNIHGGFVGFHKRIWDFEEIENGIQFKYFSPDGEERYPGNLNVSVRYTIENGNTLKLEYFGSTDKDTLCNLTNHSYFNLAGHDSGTMLNQYIQIEADYFAETDKNSFPNGNLVHVKDTVMDFRKMRRIGEYIDSADEQLIWNDGYDHNYVIRGYDGSDVLRDVAYAYAKETGITMKVKSNMPGVQFYSGNSLSRHQVGKTGLAMKKYDGFCLETQYFPDAMSHDNFEKPILRVGNEYHHVTSFEFSNDNEEIMNSVKK